MGLKWKINSHILFRNVKRDMARITRHIKDVLAEEAMLREKTTEMFKNKRQASHKTTSHLKLGLGTRITNWRSLV